MVQEIIVEGADDSGIFVDQEGNWFYRGNPIIREDILTLFYENLAYEPDRGYYISWQGKQHFIKTEDTPFVITRVDLVNEEGLEKLKVQLKHLHREEELDLESLFVGKMNILYCSIVGKTIPARFSRPAYYQICHFLEEDKGHYFITLGNKKYAIGEEKS